jgi:uncharacterized protein (DUF1778 family)
MRFICETGCFPFVQQAAAQIILNQKSPKTSFNCYSNCRQLERCKMVKKKQITETNDQSLELRNIFEAISNDPLAAKELQRLSNIFIDVRDIINQQGIKISENETKEWLAMMEQAQKIELSEENYDAFVSTLDKALSPEELKGIQSLFQRKSPWDN